MFVFVSSFFGMVAVSLFCTKTPRQIPKYVQIYLAINLFLILGINGFTTDECLTYRYEAGVDQVNNLGKSVSFESFFAGNKPPVYYKVHRKKKETGGAIVPTRCRLVIKFAVSRQLCYFTKLSCNLT